MNTGRIRGTNTMRTILFFAVGAFAVLAAPVDAIAQPYPAPSRTPVPSTAAQTKAISAGIALHDQSKYDEAIARYREVIEESPDNVTALFELAFSYGAKREYQKSLEAAGKGAEYRSDLLAMFYDVMGNTLDAMGEPQRAIAAYTRGTELVPGHALLYFNMAVTYHESLKDPDGARAALKKTVTVEPDNAEAHRLLGQLFQADGYKTPAALTLARFLILMDPNARGSLQAYGLWRAVLRGNTDPALPKIPDGAPKTDEGDFTALDRFIDETHTAAMRQMDDGQSEMQALVGQLDAVLGRLAVRDPGADRATFFGRYYVPYFVELKRMNFVEPFGYWVSQRAPVPGVKDWIAANEARVREFLQWSDKYIWPAR